MSKPIKRIVIEFIPQEQQRYDTCGDWFYEGDTLVLKISRMGNEVYQQAVALHELTEALLCNVAGITQEDVDRFDITGLGKDLDEPGFDPSAPYHKQHCWADVIERTFVAAAGLSWSEYDGVVSDTGA